LSLTPEDALGRLEVRAAVNDKVGKGGEAYVGQVDYAGDFHPVDPALAVAI